jgi:quercetin dioxygenase-like cupin family protein
VADQRIASTVVRGADATWRPLKIPGVSIKVLRSDKTTGEATALIKLEAGARFPAHNHPAGEEVFVLEGDLTIGADRLKSGDYYYTPPNGKHAASSDAGCMFLVTLPKPIEILS